MLGHPARLRFVECLETHEFSVSGLAEALGDCPNALTRASQQLRILHDEGVVHARRSGRHSFYRLADIQVGRLVENALGHIARTRRAKGE